MVERLDDDVSGHSEPASEVIPNRDAEFVTGLPETEECVAAIAADLAACPGTDLAPRDLTADVVFGPIGVERDFRPVQHHQQFGLVGMQPCQQAVQGGEARAPAEDTVEPGTQRASLTLTGVDLVDLEIGVEIPDQAANQCLGRTMLIGEGVQLVDKAFRMNPTQ